MTRSTLEELLARCERAQGPDREIDADLYRIALGESGYVLDHWTAAQREDLVRHYSSSLDDIVGLIERELPGWSRQQGTQEHRENGFKAELWQSWGPSAYRRYEGIAQTEPLALCVCFLRAKLSSGGDE